ncbi:unnamed protein product [Orchesella dallaii]|uniref:Uncharacterized protein n=1 Tax=Orchesella dallaii TaxID=48710 RepID=A0ABP1S880_9HEXA
MSTMRPFLKLRNVRAVDFSTKLTLPNSILIVGKNAYRDPDFSLERANENAAAVKVLPIFGDCLKIPLGMILKLRMINKDSNLAIIQMLEEESYNFYEKQYEKNSQQKFNEPARNVPNRTHLAKEVIQKYTFKDGESVQKFIGHFGPISSSRLLSHKRMTNPFFSRSLYISTECSGEENPKVVNPCRVLMLETFGHQIRNVTFHISGTLLGDRVSYLLKPIIISKANDQSIL